MAIQHLQPVSAGERLQLLDVLRGFALLGILLVNFHGEPGGTVDSVVSSFLAGFVSESFYPLFSFLFGLGFAVQLSRARARDVSVALLYARRMLVLFVIGTVHSIFIWGGDILVRYALAGLVLIPLHRLRRSAVLALAGVLLLTILNGDAVRARAGGPGLGGTLSAQAASGGGQEGHPSDQAALLSTGGYTSYVQTSISRAKDWAAQVRGHGRWSTWALNDVLFCFLIGFAVGRSRVLQEAADRIRAIAMFAAIAFVTAATGILVMATLDLGEGFVRAAAWHAENFGLTAVYISGITLLFTLSARSRRVLGIFAQPGRLGLTNYLTQSFVMTWMSMPYGLGWQPSTAVWLLFNLFFFFGVQIPVSRWWLARYQYGPAEWLWRTLTYGAIQPMRLRSPATVKAGVGELSV